MPEREKLLKEIRAFLAKHKMAPSRFGRDAMNDANFVARISDTESPRDVKSETIDHLRRWMAEHKPRPTGGAVRAKSKAA